ncbi:zinc finger CCCH domain-containing protein 11A-like isoform X1 [Anoplophora glabripennis]|uniref:zinc finger CCCH domain-containing protein 11A-like isoform X1 n=1 Tax=Anoplophora glabripennis TaxID=217634 RepID=UPI000874C743|nr:zinc finger CCCH domain-containing protein 11A-like isoform X1 [Anoplophora glabripennis]
MTDLESPKKNNDCYFYYYSTCAKGDSCTFRHEPSALGCETMCSFWKEGKCLNVHCNFRHMELRKNRKVIPCYWESQPVGCLKAHCPFLHQNPRPSDEVSVEKSNISAEKSNNDSESSERKVTAVDSLVVNFEEESDNESMPTFSPLKSGRIVKVKSLEEIKLEKIQAESAAYYSYSDQYPAFQHTDINCDDLRQRIVRRVISKQLPQQRTVKFTANPNDKVQINKRLSNDELADILGDESLRKKQKVIHQKDDGNFQIVLNKLPVPENKPMAVSHNESQDKKPKKNVSHQKPEPVQDIKVKTLAEIRAERLARMEGFPGDQKMTIEEPDEAEVSSTSADENLQKILHEDKSKSQLNSGPKRKIKLRRRLNISEEDMVSTNVKDENVVTSNEENVPISRDYEEIFVSEQIDISDKQLRESPYSSNLTLTKPSTSDSDKMEEDVLLLEDDEEEYEDVTLKGEDELLNELNSFIDN